MTSSNAIFIVNSGSSSVKFAVYIKEISSLELYLEGHVKNIGSKEVVFTCKNHKENISFEEDLTNQNNYSDILEFTIKWTENHLKNTKIRAFGHRVVHGGKVFTKPILINTGILKELKELIPFAPLHQPHNIEAIEIIAKSFPQYPQIACFDTSFHTTNSKIAQKFALPKSYYEKGVHRYGFHGLSYEYISNKLQDIIPSESGGRVIVAHLGNGASICAMKNSKSIDSTMGFTALDGLMMGTRCGSIDPGVLLYLLEKENLTYKELERLLYHKSGLLGVSGISNDVSNLLNSDKKEAKGAIELFIYYIIKYIGSLTSVLQGLDILVFTGGIGENSSIIRKNICSHFKWLGIEIVDNLNNKNEIVISSKLSKVKVMVLATNEELIMAQHVDQLLKIS